MSRVVVTCSGIIVGVALLTPLLAAAACAPHAQRIADNNSLILLGGTARGPVKQFVMGEFGKNVDQQRRLLGNFDRCGSLVHAELSFDKREGGVQISMAQSIMRVAQGWEAVYELSVMVDRQGKQVEVNHKQGTISYMRGKSGNIVSSTDRFLLLGKPGFTETTNTFDRQQRLIKSVSRGSDSLSNGTTAYRWNRQDLLQTMTTDGGKIDFSYDPQGREQRLSSFNVQDTTSTRSVDECQLWDDSGNCTLSYSHESEVAGQGKVERNISAAYRFEYWDVAKNQGQ